MYDVFAKYYNQLTQNISYAQRAVYFQQVIEKHFGKATLVLDLACGTGKLSSELEKLGYDVTAVDKSQEMLTLAMEQNYENNQSVLYLCQDMCRLDLYGTMDVVICALDSLNHLPSASQVQQTFQRVSLFVENGGLFLFDVNTIYKHQNVLANNNFVYETTEVFCSWQNQLHKDGKTVDITLDFFEEDKGVYYRSREAFTETAYGVEELTQMLDCAEFDVEAVYGEDSFDPPEKDCQRLIFVAKRRIRR